MRVLVWGVNYHPEQVGIAPYNTALCEHLKREGHDVEMVSTFAYYPMWRKAAEDRRQVYRGDTINGVPVHRCWHYVPRAPSGLRRIVHEATFVAVSTPRALLLKRADVIVVVSPPLLLGAAAWLVGRLKGTPHVLHIQDLQPDAAVELGMMDSKWFIGLMRRLERFSYRKAARVSVISEGMLHSLEARGVERLAYFPNWVATRGTEPGAFRAKWGIGRDEFVLLYSGNIGIKQGIETIVEAAARATDVRLIICGDGAARPGLEKWIAAHAPGNVMLLPLQPDEDYRRMMADADVCVICQRAGTGAAFFPSKLLASVAFGKPVLAVADRESDLSRVVREEGLGISVATEDIEAVAEMMRGLRGNPAKLEECARNGRAFAARFEEGRVLGEFEKLLKELAEPKRIGSAAANT